MRHVMQDSPILHRCNAAFVALTATRCGEGLWGKALGRRVRERTPRETLGRRVRERTPRETLGRRVRERTLRETLGTLLTISCRQWTPPLVLLVEMPEGVVVSSKRTRAQSPSCRWPLAPTCA